MIVAGCGGNNLGASSDVGEIDYSIIVGRWDVTIYDIQGVYPSWFEIAKDEDGLHGRFVGRVGHARLVPYVHFDGVRLTLSLPRQYERPHEDLIFVGDVSGDKIDGRTRSERGEIVRFRAERAADLVAEGEPEWGEPINLIRDNLAGWQPRNTRAKNAWKVEDSLLVNTDSGADLITSQTFRDFKLHLEYKIPKGSNSGIYLRGRYEVQIEDNYGEEPHSRKAGGVYGFLTPTKMMIKAPGEWNFCDITLIGRKVTVVLNGETIIDNKEIPGITGGALNSRESEPGPLMLQGDHGKIEFRNVILTPAK